MSGTVGRLVDAQDAVGDRRGTGDDGDGEDVTEEFFRGAEAALKLAMDAGVKRAILKSRSPSCGYGEVYDGSFSRRLTAGSGITAELFASWGIEIENEENYIEKERAEE